jgi:hypothetical protein
MKPPFVELSVNSYQGEEFTDLSSSYPPLRLQRGGRELDNVHDLRLKRLPTFLPLILLSAGREEDDKYA